MHLEWDERGIRFAAQESLPPRTETVSVEGRTIHRVPWEQVEKVEPVDPWPALRVSWDGASEVISVHDRDEAVAFAARVEALMDEARRRIPEASALGWLAVPELEWEEVKYMPGESPAPREQGAYRSHEAAAEELPVVVRRPPLNAVRAFFDWLASTIAFPFREQPLEVALTHEDVYARFRGDGGTEWVGRCPRSALRARVEVPRAGTIYVFGRAARLLVPAAAPNEELSRELDAQLVGPRAFRTGFSRRG